MPIQVKCKSCGKMLQAPDTSTGKKGRCPGCGSIFVVTAKPVEEDAVALEVAPPPTTQDEAKPSETDATSKGIPKLTPEDMVARIQAVVTSITGRTCFILKVIAIVLLRAGRWMLAKVKPFLRLAASYGGAFGVLRRVVSSSVRRLIGICGGVLAAAKRRKRLAFTSLVLIAITGLGAIAVYPSSKQIKPL